MKQLLNTLYVTTDGAYVSRDGETITVRVEKETKIRVPIRTITGVVCLGRVNVSPPALDLCAKYAVNVSYLSLHGRFIARVQGPVSGNVLLRRSQYRMADDINKTVSVARSIVTGKAANCRTVLVRGSRECNDSETSDALHEAAGMMTRILEDISKEDNADRLRGREGEAARTYFGVFNHLIANQDSAFSFNGRNRRPPLDPVNALLSFVYTLLLHDISSALETTGLDPYVGYLHRDRPGRMGLALDLMEEFRPFFADRLVLTLINRRQLSADDFKKTESGAVHMSDEARKKVLTAYQTRKRDELMHPFLEENVQIGILPFIQATLMARHIRGDIDGYPPFLWR